MKRRTFLTLGAVPASLFLQSIPIPQMVRAEVVPTGAAEVVPTGITFQESALMGIPNNYKSGYGDNWCQTWTADDSIITSMCDGNWLNSGHEYHSHLYRIKGGYSGFTIQDIPDYPDFESGLGGWFGYGILSVDGILYSFVSKTTGNKFSYFRGIKLLKSYNNGRTWYRVNKYGNERKYNGPNDPARLLVNKDEMFFLEEFGIPHVSQKGYPFSYVDFVQCGKDNSQAKDNYIYIYSPEGAQAHKLLLARVHKTQLGVRSKWEYFTKYDDGQPVWSPDIHKRGVVYTFPNKNSEGRYSRWYSWQPSVVWNRGLGLYIMVNYGWGWDTSNDDSHYYRAGLPPKTGSLGFYYSENPYGPWNEFFYTEYWTVEDSKELTYQPKLSPKWISADGKEMVLIWSDAKKNDAGRGWTVNYVWNQMKITIETSASGSPTPDTSAPDAPQGFRVE